MSPNGEREGKGMPITPQTEHPPLLSIGFHLMTIDQLRDLCVSRFPDSATRSKIMDGLEKVIAKLTAAGIQAEIWVNGSFLTAKRDPDDTDIVLRVDASVYDSGTDGQRAVLDWVKSNLKNDHLCDSYVFYVFAPHDQRAVLNDYNHAYWIRQYGFSRGKELKGIAVLKIGGNL